MMNFLQRVMYGRHGLDQFSVFLFALYLLLYLLYGLLGGPLLLILAMTPFLYCAYRMFSKKLDRRRAENARFMVLAGPVVHWFKLRWTVHKDKEHRYFKCPNCGQQLRVPRGKGKITISCRNCGVSFEEKT